MPHTRAPVIGHNGRPAQPPARRWAPPPGERGDDRRFIDEVVTGLGLLAAQAEAALEAAHQDVAAAEVAMLEAMHLAPETPALKRTIIRLGLRDLLERHAGHGPQDKTPARSRRRPGTPTPDEHARPARAQDGC